MGVTETSAAFIQGRTDYSLHKSGKVVFCLLERTLSFLSPFFLKEMQTISI